MIIHVVDLDGNKPYEVTLMDLLSGVKSAFGGCGHASRNDQAKDQAGDVFYDDDDATLENLKITRTHYTCFTTHVVDYDGKQTH